MKRLLCAFLLLAVTAAAAPEKWFEAYDRGVTAVNAKSYKVAADALQKSIAEMPAEGINVRTRRELITYLPHFWLGIAKFNLGDPDAALREWRISEEQGVITRTEYYARMKDWVARAQVEKQRNAQSAALGSKKAADTAISRALEVQLDALSAGGDRSESYLAAQRKLQVARGQFQKAGTDVTAYRMAEVTAQQAAALFASAADEGKKLKAARAAAPPPVKKVQPQPAPVQQAQAVPPPVVAPPPAVRTDTAPAPQVLTEAEAAKRIAEQAQKRQAADTAAARPAPQVAVTVPPAVPPPPVAEPSRPAGKVAELRAAYHAFASGDLASSERLLTHILSSDPAAEAYLLRGCARYTRAVLSRTPDPILLSATDDFRAALQRNPSLRLDRRFFSPKLVAFYDGIRQRR